MSIRLRLTLLFSGILAVTLLVFSASLYLTQAQLTLGSLKASLQRQTQGLIELRLRDPGHFGTGTSIGILRGRWTDIRGPDGAVTARSSDLGDLNLPLSQDGLRSVQNGEAWSETAQLQGEPLLIYSQPAMQEGRVAGIVQVAAPIAEREQSLWTLRVILIVGSALVLVVAFLAGWLLAGMALNPIHRMTKTAQAIGEEQDFGRRVEHTGPNDEVGQLAVTFNKMLGQLESAYRQMEEALQTQRRFVADASHELRTPLTTIRGNIELLRRSPPIDPKEQPFVLADAQEETERLIRLVNQLLLLARADAGRSLKNEPVELKPLVEDVYRQTMLLAPERRIYCEDPADLSVMADRDALKQVLLILLDNAVVHTRPGTAIRLTTRAADGRASIRVADDGPGIPPEQLAHIFERFYRGEVSRSGPGAGLGLSIAQELVEGQAGELSVESQVGKGTAFVVTLPRVKE